MSRLATPAEAAREFARNVGMERPQQAWILTSYDTWEPNPFYTGPKVRHPEEEPEGGPEAYGPWQPLDDELPF